MEVKKILQCSIDLSDPIKETKYAIRAVLSTMPTLEAQKFMLQELKVEIDTNLKGVEEREQPVSKS